MTKSADLERRDRRTFLRGLAGAGAGATALVMAGRATGSDDNAKAGGGASGTETRGYRETDHIKTYYDKARF